MSLVGIQHLFPQGVRNFNNLIYNIRSYNKAHFGEGNNYYKDRKGFGGKYLDGSFAGHVIRAFSEKTINKHNEVIVTEENILHAMYHSVSGYLDGYMKRAKGLH